MARITPNADAGSAPQTQRAEKITAGTKTCVILGYFFETAYGNKKLQIGYAVIDDGGNEPTENGIIHIGDLLIRDTVAWKHQIWAAGCGYTDPYDNEDHEDIQKIILGCKAIKCEFQERSYTNRNGEDKTVIEIARGYPVANADADALLGKTGMDKLISGCEQSFQKIVDYRVSRGDQIERAKGIATVGGTDANDDFDAYVGQQDFDNTNAADDIPF